MKTLSKNILILSFALLNISQRAQAGTGTSSGGGGDQFTIDFIRVAAEEVYPWLVENGKNLTPPVDAEEFKKSIDPKRIESKEVVYESCDGTTDGRVVAACYNDKTKMIYISQRLYPLDLQNSPSKRALVMHEQFRKMGIEGDNYEFTRGVSIYATDPFVMLKCVKDLYSLAGYSMVAEKKMAISLCEKTGADPRIYQCVIDLYSSANFSMLNEKKLAVSVCEKTNAAQATIKCIKDLYHDVNFSSLAEKELSVRACSRVGGDPKFVQFMKSAYRDANFSSYEEKLMITRSYIKGFAN